MGGCAIAGTIFHILSGCGREKQQKLAYRALSSQFEQITIGRSMFLDHMPSCYALADKTLLLEGPGGSRSEEEGVLFGDSPSVAGKLFDDSPGGDINSKGHNSDRDEEKKEGGEGAELSPEATV